MPQPLPNALLSRLKTHLEYRSSASAEAVRALRGRRPGASELLVRETLRTAESTLRQLSGAKHIELSVWAEPARPAILAYYDTAGNNRPRTDHSRRTSATYYRDQGYDVIELLDSPANEPIFKERLSAENYSFLSEDQKKQIKSTFLHCIDPDARLALVATADKARAFAKSTVPRDLIYAIGHAVRADLSFRQLECSGWALKPRVFIGSSVEGKAVADHLSVALEHDADCTVWSDGVFGLSETSIESLETQLRSVDFAILIATPDDKATKRGRSVNTMRDNVLFEFGLFIGALGRKRVFLVQDASKPLDLPSDLGGVTVAKYQPRTDGNVAAAVRSPATKIVAALHEAAKR
jgi:predicted nucleotide-binding protein